MSLYTDAQKEALEKAYDLLGEHFDASLIVVSAEVQDPADEKSSDCIRVYWSGGFPNAIGLASIAAAKIMENDPMTEAQP